MISRCFRPERDAPALRSSDFDSNVVHRRPPVSRGADARPLVAWDRHWSDRRSSRLPCRRRKPRSAARRRASSGRSDPDAPVKQRRRRHAGEPAALAARLPHRYRLDLVVGVWPVRTRSVPSAARPRPAGGSAPRARRRKTARRLLAVPAQRAMGDAVRARKAWRLLRLRARIPARSPWSTVTATSRVPDRRVERLLSRRRRAVESLPPETAATTAPALQTSSEKCRRRSVRSGSMPLPGGAQHAASACSCLTRSFSAPDDSG